MSKSLHRFTGIIIKSLRFDEKNVAKFEPNSIKFGFLPIKLMDFSVKVEQKEAKIMTREIVFWAGIAEANDELHGFII